MRLEASAFAVVLALSAALLAGAAPPFVIEPGAPPSVADDKALVVIALDSPLIASEIRLRRFEGTRSKEKFDVAFGATSKFTAKLVSLRPGRYRIERVTLEGGHRWKPDEQIEFEAHPAAINYFGDLAVATRQGSLTLHTRDRSGRARIWAQETHAALAAGFPFRYVGDEDDGWTDSVRR